MAEESHETASSDSAHPLRRWFVAYKTLADGLIAPGLSGNTSVRIGCGIYPRPCDWRSHSRRIENRRRPPRQRTSWRVRSCSVKRTQWPAAPAASGEPPARQPLSPCSWSASTWATECRRSWPANARAHTDPKSLVTARITCKPMVQRLRHATPMRSLTALRIPALNSLAFAPDAARFLQT